MEAVLAEQGGPKETLDELGLRKSLVRKVPRPRLATTGLVGIIRTQMLAFECKVKTVFSSGREGPTLKLAPPPLQSIVDPRMGLGWDVGREQLAGGHL